VVILNHYLVSQSQAPRSYVSTAATRCLSAANGSAPMIARPNRSEKGPGMVTDTGIGLFAQNVDWNITLGGTGNELLERFRIVSEPAVPGV
jgi:hypothetical protein